MPRAFAPLRHRGFRLLAAGQLASNVGDAFYAVALPWYVLSDHGGALLLGIVLAAYGVPRTVLLAFGGHASDRWRPFRVMIVADTIRAVAVAGLAVVAVAGPARVALLVPIAAVLGAGEGLFLPGSFAIIPSLLSGDDLQAGNALSSGGAQLATLVGPALGGIVVALAGASLAFGVDAISFVVSALTLGGLARVVRAPPVPESPAEAAGGTGDVASTEELSFGEDIVSGERVASTAAPLGEAEGELPVPALTLRRLLVSEPMLLLLLGIVLAANLGSGGLGEVALPALAHGPFHAGATGYGDMVAGLGGGALLGTVVAAQLRPASRPVILGSLLFLVEAGFMAAIPYLGGVLGAGAGLAAFGALNGIGNLIMITAFQRWAPPEMMGRLMGLILLGSFGTFPVSVLFGAVVVHDFGPAIFFPLAAGILALTIGVALTQRRWREFGTAGGSPAGTRAGSLPLGEQADESALR